MAKINIALCGIGGYAMLYTRYILDREDPRICPVGVVEPYPASCPRLADLEAAGIPVYATPEELYAAHQVDLTVIATPIQCHTPQILTALRNGSHVLCEKPLSGMSADETVLLDAARAAGKFVMIGYQWSYAKAILDLKADILAGRYGQPVLLKSRVFWPRSREYYARGGGWGGKLRAKDGTIINDSVVSNATAHYLHNMLFLLGQPGCSREAHSVECDLLRANEIENYDTAVVRFGLEGGGTGLLVVSHATLENAEPAFEYRFTAGTVCYSAETGEIVGCLADGTRISYGDPFANVTGKVDAAMAACRLPVYAPPCGIAAAAPQVRCVEQIQTHPIRNFRRELLRLLYKLEDAQAAGREPSRSAYIFRLLALLNEGEQTEQEQCH